MKQWNILFTIVLACLQLPVSAQQKANLISPYRLSISTAKTTNIIFPFTVISADRGSLDVLVQKLKGAENILQVKAAKQNFNETNLSVVTADGKFYSFILDYAVVPNVLNMSFLDSAKKGTTMVAVTDNTAQFKDDCGFVDTQKIRRLAKDKSAGVSLKLQGIFVNDDVLYFKLGIKNISKLNYTVDVLRFSVHDKHKGKRYAIQEQDKKPTYINNNVESIKAGTSVTVIYAIPSFTIPDKKCLLVELQEKNGGRHLQIQIGARKLMKASPIN